MSGPSALLSSVRLPGVMRCVCWLLQAEFALHKPEEVQLADTPVLLLKLRSLLLLLL